MPGDWVSGYSRFQSGGWGTLSLLNDTGNARDVTIGDADPVPTDLLQRMPTTRALLGELGLKYMWARLALLGAGSYLWEHRDYQEDELTDAERHRVHIPITTTSSAFLVLGGSGEHLPTSCAREVGELANTPAVPALASLERMLDLALALARRAAPETTEELARAIDAYRHYLDLG